jgi:hypothetical protein
MLWQFFAADVKLMSAINVAIIYAVSNLLLYTVLAVMSHVFFFRRAARYCLRAIPLLLAQVLMSPCKAWYVNKPPARPAHGVALFFGDVQCLWLREGR